MTRRLTKIYGGIPTANENMSWKEDTTFQMKSTLGLVKIDSTCKYIRSTIEAFMITFQPLQDANIMTKQMRNNSAFGSALGALNGD